MSAPPLTRYHLRTLGAVIAIGLAACSDDGGNGPSTDPSLTFSLADSLAQSVVLDASDFAAASTMDDAGGTGLGLRTVIPADVAALPVGASCTPVRSPLPIVQSDADGIPDSLRFTFTDCTFTRGVVTSSVSGTVDVVDPQPLAAAFAIRFRFGDFAREQTNAQTSRTIGITWNGVRSVSGTADAITHEVDDFRTDFLWPNGRTAVHVVDWTGQFTADVPGTIAAREPLPAGLLQLTGTSTWARELRTWQVTAATPTALHYAPTCVAEPRFDAGVLQLTAERAGATTTVRITFTACGVWTVERV